MGSGTLVELFGGFLELGEDQILRAAVGGEAEDGEFISGDAGLLVFAVIADLGEDGRNLILLGDRFADRGVASIDSKMF